MDMKLHQSLTYSGRTLREYSCLVTVDQLFWDVTTELFLRMMNSREVRNFGNDTHVPDKPVINAVSRVKRV